MWNLHQLLENDLSCLNVFFKVVDISMETIYQNSNENLQSMNFIPTRSVTEKADANFWNYDIWQEKYTRINNYVGLISNKSRKYFKLCFLFSEMKWEHYFNEIAPKGTQMRIEVMFWGDKRFVALCSLDMSWTRPFLNIIAILKLDKVLILKEQNQSLI